MKVGELRRMLELYGDNDEIEPNGACGFVISARFAAVYDESTGRWERAEEPQPAPHIDLRAVNIGAARRRVEATLTRLDTAMKSLNAALCDLSAAEHKTTDEEAS